MGERPTDKLLTSEYDHIAQAHFATEQIISQFKYYLLTAAAPIPGAAALGGSQSAEIRDMMRDVSRPNGAWPGGSSNVRHRQP